MTQAAPPPKPEAASRQRNVNLLPGVAFRSAGNPSLPTFVALMLIVTTFMIVLASISMHDASRLKDVLSSMRATFGTAPGESSMAADTADARSILAETATGFRAAVPATLPMAASGGQSLLLVVPLVGVLDPESRGVKRDFAHGLGAIAAALAQLPADIGYRVELRFGRDGETGMPLPPAAFAAALADAAAGAGLSTGAFSIGAGPGPADRLSLRIDLAAIPPRGEAP